MGSIESKRLVVHRVGHQPHGQHVYELKRRLVGQQLDPLTAQLLYGIQPVRPQRHYLRRNVTPAGEDAEQGVSIKGSPELLL